ncbi:MAG: hypothetical protein WCE53_12485 [Candidatus Acidiferrum sp.]
MSQFRFQVLQMRYSTPQEWLRVWAGLYQGYDETEYRDLIEKHKSFSAEDFRRIGKWKDGATTQGQWKPNVASVAYLIWEQAADELPNCSEESEVVAFLEDWSDRAYTDIFKNGPRKKHFGLSRATTLLHFVSGGHYPIFDSRVKTAIARLLDHPELPGTVSSYLDSYLPLFKELADRCETDGFRTLDKALFSYGALEERTFSN